MQFDKFKSARGDRELMIKFTCLRCKKEHIEPLSSCINRSGDTYGYLHNFYPPKGWWQVAHSPLLCPDCHSAYEQFMANEKEAEDEKDT